MSPNLIDHTHCHQFHKYLSAFGELINWWVNQRGFFIILRAGKMNTCPCVSGPFALLPLGLSCPYFEDWMTAFLEPGVPGQRVSRSSNAEQSSGDDSGSGSSVREQCAPRRSRLPDKGVGCTGEEDREAGGREEGGRGTGGGREAGARPRKRQCCQTFLLLLSQHSLNTSSWTVNSSPCFKSFY